jgi:hypothetical protein
VLVYKDKKAATLFRTQPGQRESATVIECIGHTVPPPMVIFKGKAHMLGWFRHQQQIPQNWAFAVSQNGWTNQDIGLDWLQRCFEPHTRPQNANQKRLLLLDGHNSHTSLAFTEFAERNNIILLCFPAHATHLLQPLDVAIFGSLKAQYTKMISSLAKSELAINKVQFLRIYIKIRDRIITPRVARSAFKSVGIDTIVNALPVLSRLPEDRKIIAWDKSRSATEISPADEGSSMPLMVTYLLPIQKGNWWSIGKVEGRSTKWGERKQVAPKWGQILSLVSLDKRRGC